MRRLAPGPASDDQSRKRLRFRRGSGLQYYRACDSNSFNRSSHEALVTMVPRMMISLIIILVLAWLGLRALEPRLLYFPDRQLIATPAVYRLAFDDLVLRDQDGTKIHAWLIPALHKHTILFCHGNAGNISHRLDKIQKLHALGLDALFFDYRGYGQSEGKPSEAGTYADAEAAYQYLVETKKTPSHQIILYGESLGCAVAVEMARRHPVGGIILESPFTSTAAMARRVFPWLPVQWIVRNRYDNLAKIRELKMPVLIMHSPQDEIIPFKMGRQLFAAAPDPKQFYDLTGSHNDGYSESGEHYTKAITAFISSGVARP